MASFSARKVSDTIAAELGQFGLRQIDTLTFGVEKTPGLVSGLWIQSRNIMEAKRLSDFGWFGIWKDFERIFDIGLGRRFRLGRAFTATQMNIPHVEPCFVYQDTLEEDCQSYLSKIAPLLQEGVERFSTYPALENYVLEDWKITGRYPERMILMELLLRGVDDAEAEYSTFLQSCQCDSEVQWVMEFWGRIRQSDRYQALK